MNTAVGIQLSGLENPLIENIEADVVDENLDLRLGDRLAFVNGQVSEKIANMVLRTVCFGGSSIATFEREGQFFEAVISHRKVIALNPQTLDFPAADPFSGDHGYDSPTWQNFYHGDFSEFDQSEKETLIVLANSAISRAFKTQYPDDSFYDVIPKTHPTAMSCYPYGVKSVGWNQNRVVKDSFGNVQSSSQVMEGILYFDNLFRNIMIEKWETTRVGTSAYHPINHVIDRYGCFSAEYRMLYNRLFQLLK